MPGIAAADLFTDPLLLGLHELDLEDVYKRLDKEISWLQERLCSLRTLRNSLPPIAKIPAEILSKIFSELQEPIRTSLLDDVDVRSRFYISWVCRHWRRTALGTPSLWTIISKQNRNSPIDVDIARDLLARSHNFNISIHLSQPTRDMLTVLTSHMHRTEHLRMSNVPTSMESDELLSQPAPMLASLDLDNTHIPSNLVFTGALPQLCRLSVADMDFLTPSPLVTPTLTSLRMVRIEDGIDVSYLLGVLPSLQNLRELALIQALYDQHVAIPTERMLHPCLESLTLSDHLNWSTYLGLLNCLDIPQTDITLVWTENLECERDSVRNFLSYLKTYLAGLAFPIRYIKAERKFPEFTINVASTGSQHRYSFQFPKAMEKEWTDEFVDYAFPLDSLGHLETLSMTEFPLYAAWVLRWLPNVRNVTLFGLSTLTDFLPAFRLDLEVMHSEKISFPAVKELTISKVSGSLYVESLLKALVIRYEMKMGLHRLAFVGCEDVDVDIFKSVVDIVSLED
ncbi:hypothetical protein BDN72DRAFT_882019 [Pluteus cervinus]|uniref:Uncharacterized protein n=1 Tax=Pluteus cervinus TaxID=181527 RepID=A0ACD3AD57_9AGAR|nr:hypothetical protein BDN72DRAFT_882019 [Pluteus cervinus]